MSDMLTLVAILVQIDIRSNKKASLRLLNACEAAKLRLSANTEAAVNVE